MSWHWAPDVSSPASHGSTLNSVGERERQTIVSYQDDLMSYGCFRHHLPTRWHCPLVWSWLFLSLSVTKKKKIILLLSRSLSKHISPYSPVSAQKHNIHLLLSLKPTNHRPWTLALNLRVFVCGCVCRCGCGWLIQRR